MPTPPRQIPQWYSPNPSDFPFGPVVTSCSTLTERELKGLHDCD